MPDGAVPVDVPTHNPFHRQGLNGPCAPFIQQYFVGSYRLTLHTTFPCHALLLLRELFCRERTRSSSFPSRYFPSTDAPTPEHYLSMDRDLTHTKRHGVSGPNAHKYTVPCRMVHCDMEFYSIIGQPLLACLLAWHMLIRPIMVVNSLSHYSY